MGHQEPENGFHLRWAAARVGRVLQALTEKSLLKVSHGKPRVSIRSIASSLSQYHSQNPLSKVVSHLWNLFGTAPEQPCHLFMSRLSESGRPNNQLVANVLGLAVASVNYARGASRSGSG
jgi:hypothetical protein